MRKNFHKEPRLTGLRRIIWKVLQGTMIAGIE